MNTIRALIVDDHAIVADGLERILQLDGRVEVIGSVRTLQEAKVFLQRTAPDVILLDLRLPDSHGAATVAAVKQVCPSARIVVLTGYDWADELKTRQMGVDAFLKKEMASDTITQTVSELFEGDSPHPVRGNQLTPRELEVARLVSEGMTNPEIARALYISPDTVKTHLAHIMDKTGLSRRLDLARWWRQRFDSSPPSSG